MKKIRFVANASLIVFVVLISIVAFEFALRSFFPEYEYAAESGYELDSFRIWSRRPNIHFTRTHPDTNLPHNIYYNNLAMRQHENIDVRELSKKNVIAVFGDSFTENLRLPVQYTFTDILDFLLNKKGDNYQVLNFGVDGYGTDQSYLYYSSSDVAKSAQHVIYMFFQNDLRNIYENSLFSLDEEGDLVKLPTPQPSLFTRAVSKLYVTYFTLNAWSAARNLVARQVFGKEGTVTPFDAKFLVEHEIDENGRRKRFHDTTADGIENMFVQGRLTELDTYLDIFYALLERWKNEVEDQGGQFHVVLLPLDYGFLEDELVRRGYSVLNLYDRFKRDIPTYRYNDIKFKNDGHWNELGNMYAAKYLFEFLKPSATMDALRERSMDSWLATYYSAYTDGWFPSSLEAEIIPDEPVLREIREHYLKLEFASAHRK